MTRQSSDTDSRPSNRRPTGIPRLDTVLHGGLKRRRATLVRGPPGAGKTLFGLHFLAEGVNQDEDALFINFGEPEEYIRDDVASFGLELDSVEFLDLGPSEDEFAEGATYSVFQPAEVEGPTLASELTDAIDAADPDRTVIDPATQLRYTAPDVHQFRQQMLSFLRLLRSYDATTVFTSQKTAAAPDDDMQFLSDAVINLGYDDERRYLQVTKFRGSDFQSGRHTVRITDDGMVCLPILIPQDHGREFASETISSGVPELDELLHGGIERGTVTFFSGPTGAGKTTTGLQFMKEAAGRGENSVLYSFEEGMKTLLDRSASLNIPVSKMLDRGTLRIEVVQPKELTVHGIAQRLRSDVEEHDAKIVMLDGFDGYVRSLRGITGDGVEDLHRIGRYLKNMGVTTIVTNEVHDITGEFKVTEEGASYLADNIVFLGHIEHRGELRKVIGVVKKRTSDYERRLRELEMTQHGIKVGDPLPELRGILSGMPQWADDQGEWPGDAR